MKKLSSKRGETLAEVLVAILIVALSAALLASMVSAAVSVGTKANAATEELYNELSVAESRENEVLDGRVDITPDGGSPKTVDVTYYAEDNDALMSYAKAVTP
jgi:type II secretory pathway pseudopilin PulG